MRTFAYIVAAPLVLAPLLGCGSKPRPVKPEPASVLPGQCADPERDGVIGDRPELRRADRDLDGDGVAEAVVSDQTLCAEGNCYWNLYSRQRGCWRFLGTVAGAGIQALEQTGDEGFADLVGWWSFGGRRSLRQQFSYRHGGYRLREALICREQDDDRVLCASDDGASER